MRQLYNKGIEELHFKLDKSGLQDRRIIKYCDADRNNLILKNKPSPDEKCVLHPFEWISF